MPSLSLQSLAPFFLLTNQNISTSVTFVVYLPEVVLLVPLLLLWFTYHCTQEGLDYPTRMPAFCYWLVLREAHGFLGFPGTLTGRLLQNIWILETSGFLALSGDWKTTFPNPDPACPVKKNIK